MLLSLRLSCVCVGIFYIAIELYRICKHSEDSEETPFMQQITVFQGYSTLIFFGYVRDWLRKWVFPLTDRKTPEGYAVIVRDFDDFYTRRLYNRIQDAWNRPICTRAGRTISVMERQQESCPGGAIKQKLTGNTINCINVGSYNYLGFSEDLPYITEANLTALEQYGIGACAGRAEGGATVTNTMLEEETAAFLGKKAACCFAMGFGTNFSGLPLILTPETLVFSDSLNHSSIVAGIRLCKGVKVKVFPHNNMQALETMVRDAVLKGQEPKPKPWKRIVIVVEGLYSMEGEVVDLPAVVRIKKKYNVMLYVDEAHSIGALGATGRGVCEYHSVDPADVDILMGTYTKSFGSIGGYIASDDVPFIQYMQRKCGASLYGDALFSAAAEQAISSLRVIRGEDGSDVGIQKITRLAQNSRYLRQELNKIGMLTLGEPAAPVIPVLLFNPAKIAAFSRECLKRHVAAVVVGYPATPLEGGRARLCVSASHTKEDLDHLIAAINDFASELSIRYRWPFYHLRALLPPPKWSPPPPEECCGLVPIELSAKKKSLTNTHIKLPS